MIVIARSFGQLGNRLFLYGHFIAAAAEYGVTLANPCFAEYAHLFPSTANDLWCRYPVEPISGPTTLAAEAEVGFQERLSGCPRALDCWVGSSSRFV